MTTRNDAFASIKDFLIENAFQIQKRATEHHKELLGGDTFRSEVIDSYQVNHTKIVQALADHLTSNDSKKKTKIFYKLGETLAKDSVKDGLTLEEAIDGIIFLKQALWEKLEEQGLLNDLSVKQFYTITQVTGTLVDIVVSKIAFTYHRLYIERKEKQDIKKNEFIGLISHELKTPVTSVKAFAQVLQRRFARSGDEQAATLLLKMDAQLDKLSGLIADIVDVTKLETGRLQYHKEYFDYNELVQEIVEQMQRTTAKHTIVTHLDKTKSLYADRNRIGQVLINLITNAIKYSPQADRIIVKTQAGKDDITLCIQDFGVGIPKEAQDKVFNQFYRVDGKNETTFSGMGLGLYVSAEIIKRHKGKIWVTSEKGKGSTFCFTLPSKKQNSIGRRRKSE